MSMSPDPKGSVDSSERGQGAGTKVLLFLVVLIGVSTLGYGAYSIQQSIVSPSKFANFTEEQKELKLVLETPDQEEARLRNQDTDGDTLSDYDEINFYGTSPFQADSDSDGLTDDEEVSAGTDPTCALGTDCVGIRLVTSDTKISDLFPQFSDSTTTLKDKTIQEYRQLLLEEGYDPEELAQLDNETLLIILEETLKAQDLTDSATSTIDLDEVDLDEVRLFLIDLGVPEDEVYSMSNEEIRDILNTFR